MLFDSIHTLATLALKETVPPQSRTSPLVTALLCLQIFALFCLQMKILSKMVF